MARKGKNDNPMDTAREPGGKKYPYKKKEEVTMDCGHSIGVLPYLLVPPAGPISQNAMATDRLTKLRRLYKQKFGYKPVGMSETELDAALTARGVDTLFE